MERAAGSTIRCRIVDPAFKLSTGSSRTAADANDLACTATRLDGVGKMLLEGASIRGYFTGLLLAPATVGQGPTARRRRGRQRPDDDSHRAGPGWGSSAPLPDPSRSGGTAASSRCGDVAGTVRVRILFVSRCPLDLTEKRHLAQAIIPGRGGDDTSAAQVAGDLRARKASTRASLPKRRTDREGFIPARRGVQFLWCNRRTSWSQE
jgi:hypothetical protein